MSKKKTIVVVCFEVDGRMHEATYFDPPDFSYDHRGNFTVVLSKEGPFSSVMHTVRTLVWVKRMVEQ